MRLPALILLGSDALLLLLLPLLLLLSECSPTPRPTPRPTAAANTTATSNRMRTHPKVLPQRLWGLGLLMKEWDICSVVEGTDCIEAHFIQILCPYFSNVLSI